MTWFVSDGETKIFKLGSAAPEHSCVCAKNKECEENGRKKGVLVVLRFLLFGLNICDFSFLAQNLNPLFRPLQLRIEGIGNVCFRRWYIL